ncbi:MAG: hypothetical protein V3V14_08895 [Saprospiraceae bacterium]
MKKIIFTIMGAFLAIAMNAQLTNNGGTIVVEPGAVLFIESSLQINTVGGNVGSIDIQGNGIVEVQGDVTNAGTFTMSPTAKLILSGANAADVTSGAATFTNVEMDKTAENVTLLDEMKIDTDLNFVGDNNKIIIGTNDLVFGAAATITSADDNEYIVADSDGFVKKEMTANGTFKYEIGDATNYSPLETTVTGDSYTMGTVDVNVDAMVHPNKPALASDFINRYWTVNQSGIANYSNDMVGTYDASDLEAGSDAAKVQGVRFEAGEWEYAGAGNAASQVTGTTTAAMSEFSGTNSFGKANLKVFLQGAYAGGSNKLNLNTMGLIPLTSPYDATVTVASIPANVCDWIELELRDASNPATVISSSSAFLKDDGSIVGLDGTSLPLIVDPASTTGYFAINHRNHLSIRTMTALDLDPASQTDLSDAANVYVNGAIANTPMKDLGAGTMGMWAGNVNGNPNIRYNGPANDRAFLLGSILGGNTGLVIPNVYSDGDVNFNGNVRYNGPANDRAFLLGSTLGGNTGLVLVRHL